MTEQGIDSNKIIVWQDKEEQGNLKSFLSSCEYIAQDGDDFWHLQDDICISKDFKQRTEELDKGIVAGFCSTYDTDKYFGTDETVKIGWTDISNLWFSFCCMRIPNDITKEFLDWWNKIAVRDGEVSRVCINEGKNDDYAFRIFVKNYKVGTQVYNCAPNIVNHIDYLIGGSIVNKTRGKRLVTSLFWEDDNIIEDLKTALQNTKDSI